MKKQLFLLLLTIVAGTNALMASYTKVGNIWYDFDDSNNTASVTYAGSISYQIDNEYTDSIIIPASVSYNDEIYSVTSIGEGAFYKCPGLTSVEIPNSVISIGNEAFHSCSGLTSITIPNSVNSIESMAFNNCIGMMTVTINSNAIMSNYRMRDIFGSQVTNYIIGDDITSIRDWAFGYCTVLTSITIGNNVTSIGEHAFEGCKSLTSMTIPNSVTSIGDMAFYGCTGLTSPVYNANVFAFMPNTYSGSYTIPEGIESIAGYAFSECAGLTSVTIPNSVASIGSCAFYNCPSLTSIEIQNNMASIGTYAFYDCTDLTSVIAPASIFETEESAWPGYTHSLQSVIFNGGELTYNVLGILSRSYKNLTYLDVSGVSNTELEDEAFKGFYNLQTLLLPSDLTTIGYMAVADCKNLQSINIPASVTEISQSAFENCRSLQSITFGDNTSAASNRHNMLASSNSQLQTIGSWAFYNCHELQNLVIPEGVTYIGDGAFYGCTYLENLSLPASVQSIGDNTFALCSKMKKIVVNAPVPPSIQAKTFYDVNRQIPVYVPDNCVSAYENDAQWGEFNIQGISNMPQGIDQISQVGPANADTQKLIKDGQIFILRGDKTYTTDGRLVH